MSIVRRTVQPIIQPILALLAICLPCALPAAWAAAGAKEKATVTLQGTKGESVGEAVLTETPHGVLVTATPTACRPATTRSTSTSTGNASRTLRLRGGHFNPKKMHHGFLNPQGAHAGDMPNVTIQTTAKRRSRCWRRA